MSGFLLGTDGIARRRPGEALTARPLTWPSKEAPEQAQARSLNRNELTSGHIDSLLLQTVLPN